MTTITAKQIDKIASNQHQNPFEILGSHQLSDNNGKSAWVVRAYLPKADAAWVIRPEERDSYPMHSVHHPNFFECEIEAAELKNYQLKVKEGDRERVFYDPYAFRSPKLTEFDRYLFAEGNHHRIYEK
ncbi:MAG: 1,4-alpha-glucan branching enzyme, partial [Phormidium sp. GEM2.Bin31]